MSTGDPKYIIKDGNIVWKDNSVPFDKDWASDNSRKMEDFFGDYKRGFPSNPGPFGGHPWQPGTDIFTTPIDEEQIKKDVLEKARLVNALSEDAQVELILRGEDIFDYILQPTQKVIDAYGFKHHL